MFFAGVVAVFLTYAVNNKESFKNLGIWLKDARDKSPEDAIYVLIGNKNDLE